MERSASAGLPFALSPVVANRDKPPTNDRRLSAKIILAPLCFVSRNQHLLLEKVKDSSKYAENIGLVRPISVV